MRVDEADKKGDKNIFGKNKIVKKCFIDIYITFFVVKNIYSKIFTFILTIKSYFCIIFSRL